MRDTRDRRMRSALYRQSKQWSASASHSEITRWSTSGNASKLDAGTRNAGRGGCSLGASGDAAAAMKEGMKAGLRGSVGRWERGRPVSGL